MTTALIVPHPRLDVLVDRAHDGARQRLTTYTGQIRCGARSSVLGMQAWGSNATFEHGWLLPDSLPYRADRIATVQVVVTIAPLSINELFDVQHVSANLTPDPDQIHAWLRFDFALMTKTGSVGSYRIEVLADPDAVAGPPSR